MNDDIQIASVTQVFNDGNHNAFTDLIKFKGDYYLTFRSCPEGHGVFASSRIVVLASKDAQEWEQVHEFRVPDRDVRDPHFLAFRDTLFVYSGTWLCRDDHPRDLNDHLGYGAWSRDGQDWEGPRLLEGTYGHYIWRAAALGDKAYLNIRRKAGFAPEEPIPRDPKFRQSMLAESDDGLVWKHVGILRGEGGDETAFLFEEDGAVLAVSRGVGGDAAVCRSHPPYTEWQCMELDQNIGGPMLAKWGSRLLVGGRRMQGPGAPKMALWWLEGNELRHVVDLPSGGDTSYPGFVALSPTEGLLSYYSSHEGSGTSQPPAAIYIAELRTQ